MITEAAISQAADELRSVVALEAGRLADQILGRPKLGSPEWKAQHAARDTPEGHARLREWHLCKIRICHAAKVSMTGDVINARLHGASWTDIGEACGTSRQAAHERFGKFTPEPEVDQPTEAETAAADVARRCRWAVDHNHGHPSAAWSTGEQLAVALVLSDTDHLTSMDYTVPEAMERVAGGMLEPPRNLAKWIIGIRKTY